MYKPSISLNTDLTVVDEVLLGLLVWGFALRSSARSNACFAKLVSLLWRFLSMVAFAYVIQLVYTKTVNAILNLIYITEVVHISTACM